MNIRSQYALAFCIYLSTRRCVSVAVAAKDLGVSVTFLSQVVRELRMGGVLDVKKGPGGGYWFKNDVAPSVGQILEAVDEAWVGAVVPGSTVVANSINESLRSVYERSIKEFASTSNAVQTVVGKVAWSG